MGYIMAFSWYPPQQSAKWAEVIQAAVTKFPVDPSWGTTILPIAFGSDKDGLTALSIFLPSKGNFEKAWENIRKVMGYLADVEGCRWQIRHWTTMEEALADAASRGS